MDDAERRSILIEVERDALRDWVQHKKEFQEVIWDGIQKPLDQRLVALSALVEKHVTTLRAESEKKVASVWKILFYLVCSVLISGISIGITGGIVWNDAVDRIEHLEQQIEERP